MFSPITPRPIKKNVSCVPIRETVALDKAALNKAETDLSRLRKLKVTRRTYFDADRYSFYTNVLNAHRRTDTRHIYKERELEDRIRRDLQPITGSKGKEPSVAALKLANRMDLIKRASKVANAVVTAYHNDELWADGADATDCHGHYLSMAKSGQPDACIGARHRVWQDRALYARTRYYTLDFEALDPYLAPRPGW